MKRYVSEDGNVAKYVHDDGSETAIKIPSPQATPCGDGRFKFNVFISVSTGCLVGCKFCFLTLKKFKYHYLNSDQVSSNVIAAIEQEIKHRPYLVSTPMNLSFMGMGDAWYHLSTVKSIVSNILWHFKYKIHCVEGVDISTTLPKIPYKDIEDLRDIKRIINNSGYSITEKPAGRTDVRVFYSLHSLNNDKRKQLIPNSINVNTALTHLYNIGKEFSVIYHYMFLAGINDSIDDVLNLRTYFKILGEQLRILEYNECDESEFKNSDCLPYILHILDGINIKFQKSPGAEIKAACGMFIGEK